MPISLNLEGLGFGGPDEGPHIDPKKKYLGRSDFFSDHPHESTRPNERS